MTVDGGRTWTQQSGPSVETLTVIGGQVFRVAYDHVGCPGPCEPSLQEAAVGSASWRTLIAKLDRPGRSAASQLVGSGHALLLASYGSQAGPVSAQAVIYRSADGGASWREVGDPCSGRGRAGDEEDLIAMASAPGGLFVGLCTPHSGTGAVVIDSIDGGQGWKTTGAPPITEGPSLIGAASPTTFAVSTGTESGTGVFTAQLLVSTDAGRHWTTAASDSQHLSQATTPAWLGFETTEVGRWIGDAHTIWQSSDGGLHWSRTSFG